PVEEWLALEPGVAAGAAQRDELGNEGIAVGIGSRGGEADHSVAGTHGTAVDDRVLLHDADAESGKIVVLTVVNARHLRGLPANEGGTGLRAALDDAAHHGFRHIDPKLAGGVVVEKEERLRALHGDIVGAHGHQIDADRIVPPGVYREAQLRADAIGPGHQHWVPVTRWQLHQRAEAADAGQHLRPSRTRDERLDALDELVAGVDVDTGVAIRHAAAFTHQIALVYRPEPLRMILYILREPRRDPNTSDVLPPHSSEELRPRSAAARHVRGAAGGGLGGAPGARVPGRCGRPDRAGPAAGHARCAGARHGAPRVRQ